MIDMFLTCVKGQTITDVLSHTKREGMQSCPVALLALELLKYFKILFSETTENEKLLLIAPLRW